MTLEAMARIWFDKSPAQHEVLVKNLINSLKKEKCPSARTDIVTEPVKDFVVSIVSHPREAV